MSCKTDFLKKSRSQRSGQPLTNQQEYQDQSSAGRIFICTIRPIFFISFSLAQSIIIQGLTAKFAPFEKWVVSVGSLVCRCDSAISALP